MGEETSDIVITCLSEGLGTKASQVNQHPINDIINELGIVYKCFVRVNNERLWGN